MNDQAWILKSLNQSLLAHQEEIYDRLKPKELAAILDLPVQKDQGVVYALMKFESADGVPAGNIKTIDAVKSSSGGRY